jgi:hypothetical protein
MRDTSGTKSVSYRLSIAYRLAAIGQDGPLLYARSLFLGSHISGCLTAFVHV